MYYGRTTKIPIIPEPRAYISTDGTIPYESTQYEEVYQDYNTMTVRTKGQDREIERLKEEIRKKDEQRKQKVGDFIAYYYKR